MRNIVKLLFMCCVLFFSSHIFAATKTLKVGVLGVMSGPAASWGLVNKYCAEVTAKMYNDEGGIKIGSNTYKIEVISIDDKNDPKLAVAGAERLTRQEKIKYIIGPNVDTTATSIVPVVEAAKAMNFPYSFAFEIYKPPRSNSVLGMVASYQAGPVIYNYLKKEKGIKTVSFLSRNESDPLNQRNEGVKAAKRLNLKVVSSNATYEPGTVDFFPIVSKIIKGNPDLLVLSGVAPSDAPLLLKAARQLGYKGIISTETAQDIKILNESAGKYADGFISVGGASTPQISSAYMNEFRKRYVEHVGEWNDEAGTKVYALEMILRTFQKTGESAITDIEVFKGAIDDFNITNPFVKEPTPLSYVGKVHFQQKRQLGVPIVVNVVKSGDFKTLFVGRLQ